MTTIELPNDTVRALLGLLRCNVSLGAVNKAGLNNLLLSLEQEFGDVRIVGLSGMVTSNYHEFEIITDDDESHTVFVD